MSLEKQQQMLQTKENPEPQLLHPNHSYQVRYVGENLLAFSLP